VKNLIVPILLKSALRGFCFTAVFLGLVVTPSAFANQQELAKQQEKERLNNAISSRQISPPNSEEPERGAIATGTELVADGGFETGSSPSGAFTFTVVSSAWTWQSSGSAGTSDPRYYNPASSAARTGNWCLYFDLGPSTDHLYQTVTVPAGASATLSFWLKIGTFETSTTSAYDTLNVSVTDVSGGVPPSSVMYSNLDDNAGFSYVHHTLDVSAFAGRTIRLQFDLSADSTNATIFLLDDVSILTSDALDPNALFISDVPGDNRFKVSILWNTSQSGGRSGSGNPIPLASLGVQRGGLFWFFGADNPEVVVKVLNGCSVNGAYWVFFVAGTNVGMTTTVTDTKTGRVKTYHNPDLTHADPIQDTSAFPCP